MQVETKIPFKTDRTVRITNRLQQPFSESLGKHACVCTIRGHVHWWRPSAGRPFSTYLICYCHVLLQDGCLCSRYHPHLRPEEGRRFNARECSSPACLLHSLARTVSHETPPPSSYKSFWESEYLAKKEHITTIALADHDLSLEAEHLTTLHKLLNRDYLGDNILL